MAGACVAPTEDVVFEFLSRVALGNEKAVDVFSTAGVGPAPICTTASLLLAFSPRQALVAYL